MESSPDTRISLRHLAEYLAVRGAGIPGRRVAVRRTPYIGRLLGRLVRRFDKRHEQVARRALRDLLKADGPTVERTLTALYDHLGLTAAEVLQMQQATPEDVLRRVDTSGVQPITDMANHGQTVIMLGAHYGNWELTGLAMAARAPMVSFARPLDNPLLDDLVMRLRGRTGHRVVSKHGGLRDMMRHIRRGVMAGFLNDQNAGRHGFFSPLFGQPASTAPTGVQLALKYKLPIYVVLMRRRPDDIHHYFPVCQPIDPPDTGDRTVDTHLVLARYHQILEETVREVPGQWFGWLHQRWKARPPDGELILDAAGRRLDGDGKPLEAS